MKEERKKIYDKFGGKCAYCGCELNGKFQVDHLIPQSNFWNYVMNKRVPPYLSHLTIDDVNHIDNLMPACGSCNNYKSTFHIELFRHEIGELVRRLNSTFTQYRIAKRFGLIKETGMNVKFYFELFL